jgi:hypothetical protein
MAQAKFTVQRGKVKLQDVAVAVGSAEAQSDTMSLNIDYTNLTKGQAVLMIEALQFKVQKGPWPPL